MTKLRFKTQISLLPALCSFVLYHPHYTKLILSLLQGSELVVPPADKKASKGNFSSFPESSSMVGSGSYVALE